MTQHFFKDAALRAFRPEPHCAAQPGRLAPIDYSDDKTRGFPDPPRDGGGDIFMSCATVIEEDENAVTFALKLQ